jgi:hypothetical protein
MLQLVTWEICYKVTGAVPWLEGNRNAQDCTGVQGDKVDSSNMQQ